MYSLSTSGMAKLWFRCFEYYHAYRSGNTFNECCMCGVGAKSVAHLMKFHLLQWEVVKVKFLRNSNMTLTVLNLHHQLLLYFLFYIILLLISSHTPIFCLNFISYYVCVLSQYSISKFNLPGSLHVPSIYTGPYQYLK